MSEFSMDRSFDRIATALENIANNNDINQIRAERDKANQQLRGLALQMSGFAAGLFTVLENENSDLMTKFRGFRQIAGDMVRVADRYSAPTGVDSGHGKSTQGSTQAQARIGQEVQGINEVGNVTSFSGTHREKALGEQTHGSDGGGR